MAAPAAPEPLGPDRGLGLLYRFVGATALVVAVVFIVAAVGQLWILIPAMAVHLFVTYLVLDDIARLLRDGDDAEPPSTQELHGAAEAGAQRVLERHVQVAERLELTRPPQRARVHGPQPH